MMKKTLIATLVLSLSALSCHTYADTETTILALDEKIIGQIPSGSYVTDHPAGIKNGTKYTFYAFIADSGLHNMTHYSRIHQTEKDLPSLAVDQQYYIYLGKGYMHQNAKPSGAACLQSDCVNPDPSAYNINTVWGGSNAFVVTYLGNCAGTGGAPTKIWQIVSNKAYLNPDKSGSVASVQLASNQTPSEATKKYPDGTCLSTSQNAGGYMLDQNLKPIEACGRSQQILSNPTIYGWPNCTTQPELVAGN